MTLNKQDSACLDAPMDKNSLSNNPTVILNQCYSRSPSQVSGQDDAEIYNTIFCVYAVLNVAANVNVNL